MWPPLGTLTTASKHIINDPQTFYYFSNKLDDRRRRRTRRRRRRRRRREVGEEETTRRIPGISLNLQLAIQFNTAAQSLHQ
jgi:hypothetical protein